jgi:hypothetical protein
MAVAEEGDGAQTIDIRGFDELVNRHYCPDGSATLIFSNFTFASYIEEGQI